VYNKYNLLLLSVHKKINIMENKTLFFFCFCCLFSLNIGLAQDDPNTPAVDKAKLRVPKEDDYYRIATLPVPEDILLEVGGVATLPDGRIALSTRRGDVWMVENPYQANGKTPIYTLFASGLHEALGLAYKEDALYVAQRGELTKLADTNGDGKADVYETVYAWELSGHYHEYSFGPAIAADGSFFVTGNVAFGDEEWWRGESRVPMRGWTMHIFPDGKMEPWATGMRSPCGLGMIDNEFFYADNQGDWMGSGGIWHVTKGCFTGHPAGLRWTNLPNSPLKLSSEKLYVSVDPRQKRNDHGDYLKPENDETRTPQFLGELKTTFPEIKSPAVWLPHGILGISNSQIITDQTSGKFGPFQGQVFVGDQGQSKIMRICLEKVNGEYQGASFDFKNNFQSGVLRMSFGNDGSMFVGETNRGWGSAGGRNEGIEQLLWTGKMPFEMKTVHAMSDGFEIEFTKPIERKTAEDLASYQTKSFLYKYHPVYGSPPTNTQNITVKGVKLSEDGTKLRLVIEGLRKNYIHELNLVGIVDAEKKEKLLHSTAFYTLNNIPTGEKMASSELKNYNSETVTTKVKETKKTTTPKVINKATTTSSKVPTLAEATSLLQKNTCNACHAADKKVIGPAFKDIAQRGYSNEKIVELIAKPQPKNWPGYATEMAPMPQVSKADGLKIAAWINSLK
jgi:cytochrome c551/c552